jgi:hypothetical protein
VGNGATYIGGGIRHRFRILRHRFNPCKSRNIGPCSSSRQVMQRARLLAQFESIAPCANFSPRNRREHVPRGAPRRRAQ